MNLAIRGIDSQLGKEHADSFHHDLHPDLKADYVLANPPFNDSDWRGELLKDDKRWKFGAPPAGNANFAWVQHFIHHLAPTGLAGFVLANGSMSSNQSGEGEIRKAIIEADLVDCMVALPGQLFYSTQKPGLPLVPHPQQEATGDFRDRSGEMLFIDARKFGTMIDRVHRDLTDADIRKIADTYHLWRGDPHPASGHPLPVGEGRGEGPKSLYADVPGFCKSATLDDIRHHGHILTPGRYVGAAEVEDDGEPFEEKMARLTAELREQTDQAAKLDKPSGPIWRTLAMAGKAQKQEVVRSDFAALLADVKQRIQTSQTRAVLAVNAELVRLYWDIGCIIEERQKREGWGAAVIPRLAQELKNELPELKGFSERNIGRMLAFYREYPDPVSILPQSVAQLAATNFAKRWQNYPKTQICRSPRQNRHCLKFATACCKIARAANCAAGCGTIDRLTPVGHSVVSPYRSDGEGQRSRHPPLVHGADPGQRLEPEYSGDTD